LNGFEEPILEIDKCSFIKLIQTIFLIGLQIVEYFYIFNHIGILELLKRSSIVRSELGLKYVTCMVSISWELHSFMVQNLSPKQRCPPCNAMQDFVSVIDFRIDSHSAD